MQQLCTNKLSLEIKDSKRQHLKPKEVDSLLFFKLLGWQSANEYSSLFQQPERINYIPQILKLLLENKLYRKSSWSDTSTQSKCILGKVLLWCVCMYACVHMYRVWVCVCVCLRGVIKKWITDGYSPEIILYTPNLTAYYLYSLTSTCIIESHKSDILWLSCSGVYFSVKIKGKIHL